MAKKKPPYKGEVIETIFRDRFNPETGELSNPVVTLTEIGERIRELNSERNEKDRVSDRNTANFYKDFIRVTRTANNNFPDEVFRQGYTTRQLTGDNRSFRFVKLQAGQEEPFISFLAPTLDNVATHRIESVSVPLASRELGRGDEPWLIQVLVRLRVIETHLALFTDYNIVQLDHLQTNVKLRANEIDAVFLATESIGDDTRPILVTCEAKGRTDDVIEDQLIGQIRAAFEANPIAYEVVLPMAAKAVDQSKVRVIECGMILRENLEALEELEICSDQTYELVPPVRGIGERR